MITFFYPVFRKYNHFLYLLQVFRRCKWTGVNYASCRWFHLFLSRQFLFSVLFFVCLFDFFVFFFFFYPMNYKKKHCKGGGIIEIRGVPVNFTCCLAFINDGGSFYTSMNSLISGGVCSIFTTNKGRYTIWRNATIKICRTTPITTTSYVRTVCGM